MAVGQPLGEALDEVGLVGRELLLLPAEAAAQSVVGQAAQAPAALCRKGQSIGEHLLLQLFGASSGGIESTPSSAENSSVGAGTNFFFLSTISRFFSRKLLWREA